MNIAAAPKDFIQDMKSAGIKRGYLISSANELEISHEALLPLQEFIKASADFHEHEAIFFQIDEEMECSYWAFVHRTCRGAAQGGTRYYQYGSLAALITDGLRLSEGMTFKNALAHLWWGGGKGIIDEPRAVGSRSNEERVQMMARFGRFAASLNGCYVTAEDMNTNTEDMRIIHANCRHCTCIPVDIGGSGNPSPFTARGIMQGMCAAVDFAEGKGGAGSSPEGAASAAGKSQEENFSNTAEIEKGRLAVLKGKTVAVQGAGNVGYPLIQGLVQAGALVIVGELNPATRDRLKKEFSAEQVRVLEPTTGESAGDFAGRVLFEECDIVSPCAVGAILNETSIAKIKAKIVCGAANNQLKDPVKDSERLRERGITYVPDYVVNRMGIVNCANEMYGYLISDIEEAIVQVHPDVLHILSMAKKEDVTTFAYADVWAREESMKLHPIWGHRGARIISQLKNAAWERI